MKKFNVIIENVCNNKKICCDGVNLLTTLILKHRYNKSPFIKDKYYITVTIEEA